MPKSGAKHHILVVDDSLETLEVLQRNLSTRGYLVHTAPSVEAALEVLEAEPIDLVITDYRMPRVSGMDLVRHVRENLKDTEVMMITGYASIGGAVEAVKYGAEDYLAKPFTDEELFSAVERSLDKLHGRQAVTNEVSAEAVESYGILGESAAIKEVFSAIGKASATAATVLITGESGTGKELVARAIHYSSRRASAPFVPVNCGGIPEGLLESELFGHIKGAFTGATEARAGFFQTADGGTIFLDEIAETSLAMQVKLLRVLQDKQVCMVGDTKARHVNIRIIAATNKNLENLIAKGNFRDDLFFRLSVITITVPPLSARNSDVLIIAHRFVEKYAQELGRPAIGFTDRALQALINYEWPGNVRELENVIQRTLVMTDSEVIDAPDLPSVMRFSAPRPGEVNRTLADVELEHIRKVLAMVKGNKTQAAEILGIDRKTLRQKLGQNPTS